MSATRVICRVTIRGRVQGVGFRAWVERTALSHALEGWVRNRRDGTVEAVFAGAREEVEAMIAACRRGPGLARVDTVDAHPAGAIELAECRPGETFSQLPTV